MGKNTAKTRAPARPAAPPPKDPRAGKLLVWGVIGLIVALAAGIAIWSVSGGDDTSSSATPTTGSVPPGSGVVAPAEVQPVTVSGTPLVPYDSGATDAAIGVAPPTLTGQSFDGSAVTITPGSGGPMLVVFFAHWCPHCNRELPLIAGWRKSGQVPAGLQVFGVNTGVRKDYPNYPPSKWLPTMDWAWPVLADSDNQDAARAWGLPSYPYFVVVGADGKVKVRASGEMSIDDFDQLVRTALAS